MTRVIGSRPCMHKFLKHETAGRANYGCSSRHLSNPESVLMAHNRRPPSFWKTACMPYVLGIVWSLCDISIKSPPKSYRFFNPPHRPLTDELPCRIFRQTIPYGMLSACGTLPSIGRYWPKDGTSHSNRSYQTRGCRQSE